MWYAFDRFALVALIAFALYIAWKSLRFDWPIAFRVTDHDVIFKRGIPIALQSRIRAFFRENITVEKPIAVYALKNSRGLLQLHIRGPLDVGTKQRIRNFLIDCL